MRLTYKILPEHRLHLETIEGEITVEELTADSEAMFADPLFDASYDSIVDMRNATANMSKVELLGFTNIMEQSGMFGKSKWALISNDPIIVALSETFKNRLNEDKTIHVFNTVQAAAVFIQNPEVLNHLQDD
jgi:hypothetical protein